MFTLPSLIDKYYSIVISQFLYWLFSLLSTNSLWKNNFFIVVNLGCFHILITINYPVKNIDVYLSFSVNFVCSWSRCSEMEDFILIFKISISCFPKTLNQAVVPITKGNHAKWRKKETSTILSHSYKEPKKQSKY